MRCIQNVVMVKLPPMEQTSGGIIIPELYKKSHKYCKGEVAAVGPGKRRKKDGKLVPVDLKVGDKVLLEPHRFLTMTEDGVTYAFCREPDIVTAVEGKVDIDLEMKKGYDSECELISKKGVWMNDVCTEELPT